MTREDIEGRDQEIDDDTEINPPAPPKRNRWVARSAFVRSTNTVPSPEQWWPKRRVSAIVRQQYQGSCPAAVFGRMTKTENLSETRKGISKSVGPTLTLLDFSLFVTSGSSPHL